MSLSLILLPGLARFWKVSKACLLVIAGTFLASAGAFAFSLFYVAGGAVELNPTGLTLTSLAGSFAFIVLFSVAALALLKDPYRVLALSLPLAVAASDLAGDLADFLTRSLYTHVAIADFTAASVPLVFAVWTLMSREQARLAAVGGR